VSLYDCDENTGGFCCIPGSQKMFVETFSTIQSVREFGNYIPVGDLSPQSHMLRALPQRLVRCRAGDLILWDSRTVHCNTPALVLPTAPIERLLRLVAYVCMTPFDNASSEVIQARRMAVRCVKGRAHLCIHNNTRVQARSDIHTLAQRYSLL
jgi:hypothetical protein